MNRNRLFVASCVALVTTSMVFSIRGDVLDALGADFQLNKEQLGQLLSPAFWGFTLSILIGGSLVDLFGMRRLLTISGTFYIAAILAIVLAPFPDEPVASLFTNPITLMLYGAMLTLGLAQGLVEGVINPLCSTLFPEDKTHRMNILHAWWPGGLIVGGLLAYLVTKAMGLDADPTASAATLGWRVKLLAIPLVAVGYIALIRGQKFPETERVSAGVSNRAMLMDLVRPSFVCLWICMWLTSATELGPDQWVPSLITNLTGMQGILILVYTAGIMFVLRFFGGPLAHKFSPFGLMTISAVLAAGGLYALGSASTMFGAFVAATLFGVGKTYFWPTMLGVTSELFPKGGPVALALMGGTGNLAIAFVLPIMGRWYDTQGAAAAFKNVAVMPVVLIVLFGLFFLHFQRKGGYKPEQLDAGGGAAA